MSARSTPVWDAHAHLVPATVVAAARRGADGLSLSDGWLCCGAARVRLGSLADPAALLAFLDQHGLAGAVVSVPPALFRHDLVGAAALRWAELVNDGMAELVAAGGGRLRAFAHLPLGSGALAARHAESLGPGWAGCLLGTPPSPATFADDQFAPLWEVVASRAADGAGSGLFFCHPGECADPRLGQRHLANLVGNGYETALVAASLVFGDVVARHAGLRFALAHGGGATAMLAGRWERGYQLRRGGIGPLLLTPRQALRRMLADSVTHAPDALELAAVVFGADHILLGSDWPFPMGAGDPRAGLPDHLGPRVCAAAARHIPAIGADSGPDGDGGTPPDAPSAPR